MDIADNNTTMRDEIFSLLVKRPILSLFVFSGIVSLSVASLILGYVTIGNKTGSLQYKNNIISKLAPLVEMSDNEATISLRDKINFAERGGIPTYNIVEGNKFDLNDYSVSVLEKALASYKVEKK